jgi:hypothetical protein
MGKGGCLVLLYVCLLSAIAGGQNLVWKDTMVLVALQNPSDSGISLVQFRFTQDMEYAFTCSNLLMLNWQKGDGVGQLAMQQLVKYQSKLNYSRNFTISTSFIHSLGIQFFFDSISRFQPDENTLDTRMELKLRKNLTFTFHSNLTTRLFNGYDYSSDQGGTLLRTINSAFLTPLLGTFSAGFGWTVPRLGTFSLGLSAAKLTVVVNRDVFDQQDIMEFYGVPKEKGHWFEYGFSMHVMVDKDILKRVHWNCDLLIFKNYQKPIDLVVRNLIAIRLNKMLKATIQTRICYEKEVSENIQVENLFSLGLYFNL